MVFKPYLQTSIHHQTADALSSFVFIHLTAYESISKEITSTSAAMWIWLNSCIPSCYKRFQLPRVKCDNVTAFTLSVFTDLLSVKHGRNCCGACTMLCTQIIVCVYFYWLIPSIKCTEIIRGLLARGTNRIYTVQPISSILQKTWQNIGLFRKCLFSAKWWRFWQTGVFDSVWG